MNKQPPYLPALRTVGKTLIIIGLVDILYMLFCSVTGIPYASPFNVFAVIGGYFLMKGSLKAAYFLRRLAAFFLSACLTFVLFLPLLYPMGLLLTLLRLNPGPSLAYLIDALLVLMVLYWLLRELQKALNLAEQSRENMSPGTGRHLLLGAGIALAIVAMEYAFAHGDTAQQAIQIASGKLTGDYQYRVSSLSISEGPERKHAKGIVTAWNATEIREVPVEWTDKPKENDR